MQKKGLKISKGAKLSQTSSERKTLFVYVTYNKKMKQSANKLPPTTMKLSTSPWFCLPLGSPHLLHGNSNCLLRKNGREARSSVHK